MSDRKVILKMVMSLDGFATSPDGTHEWMFEWFGDDSNERSLRALKEAGVHAMGRRSYEIMGPHWAASEGPIASAMNEKPKAVFSRTLERAEWGPAEIFGGDLSAAIAERPFAGAADAPFISIEFTRNVATGAATPSASARCMKSRRESSPERINS